MGYFFYISYKNQDKVYLEKLSKENILEKEISNNSVQIKMISESFVKNQALLSKIVLTIILKFLLICHLGIDAFQKLLMKIKFLNLTIASLRSRGVRTMVLEQN